MTSQIADRVRLAIAAAGVDEASVAQAADISAADMNERLAGRVEFSVRELRGVGGFLRIPVTRFMEVAA